MTVNGLYTRLGARNRRPCKEPRVGARVRSPVSYTKVQVFVEITGEPGAYIEPGAQIELGAT